MLAALTVIFQKYSVELVIDKYVSEEQLAMVTLDGKIDKWQKAAKDVRELMLEGLGMINTLQMRKGNVKLRLVKYGQEKCPDSLDELWKRGTLSCEVVKRSQVGERKRAAEQRCTEQVKIPGKKASTIIDNYEEPQSQLNLVKFGVA